MEASDSTTTSDTRTHSAASLYQLTHPDRHTSVYP
jgi:hypothetical protein